MKRTLSLVLLFFLVLSPFHHACAYTKTDLELALQQFKTCAFTAEYSTDGRDFTARWERPIQVYLEGNYTDADIAHFYRLIADLMINIPGIPEIRITPVYYDSNIQIYFSPISDMGMYLYDYVEGNWGFFTFWNDENRITNAQIAIAADVTTQEERYHLITEEFVGVLGLANDHFLDYNSILYSDQNETRTLTEADRLMLEFLYDPRIPSGLTWTEIEPLLLNYYSLTAKGE